MVAGPALSYGWGVRFGRVRWAKVLAAPIAALAALVVVGCAGYPRGVRACAVRAGIGSATVCAFGLQGVRVSVTDTPDGVQLALSSVGDAAELLQRAHDIVEGTREPGVWQLTPEAARAAQKTRLAFIEEAGGVVVVARAIDPADLGEIRLALRERFDRTRSMACD
jgi:hypothetical protein